MASELLVVACRTLEAPSSCSTMRTAACEALLSAMTSGLMPPVGAVRLVWNYWKSCPSNRSWRHATGIGDINDESIRAEAMAILDSDDTGEDLRDLAVDVLVGEGHIAHIDDRFLLGLVERVRTGERAREAVRLVEAVHGARGIGPETLRLIRNRWSASQVSAVREGSVAVAAQIAEPDVEFTETMLADPDVEVRSSVAYALETDFPGREVALGLVEGRLRVEVHPRARSALLRAQAAIVEDAHAERRRRRRP